MNIENGGKRITAGYVPKLGTEEKKKYNGKPMESDEAQNTFIQVFTSPISLMKNNRIKIPFGDYGLTVRFGVYVDFGRCFVKDTGKSTTTAKLVFSGMGIFGGVTGSATGNLYVWYFVPIFFGLQGSITATLYIGGGYTAKREIALEDFQKSNSVLNDDFTFHPSIEVTGEVYGYVGVGFYGIADVRGGFDIVAKFLSQGYRTDLPLTGWNIRYGVKVSIDTFLLSIPINFKTHERRSCSPCRRPVDIPDGSGKDRNRQNGLCMDDGRRGSHDGCAGKITAQFDAVKEYFLSDNEKKAVHQ